MFDCPYCHTHTVRCGRAAPGDCYHCQHYNNYRTVIDLRPQEYMHAAQVLAEEQMMKEIAKKMDENLKKKTVATARAFPSSHGSTVYETLMYTDGTMSCVCPGWIMLRKGMTERACKHTKQWAKEIANGDYFCVTNEGGGSYLTITGKKKVKRIIG